MLIGPEWCLFVLLQGGNARERRLCAFAPLRLCAFPSRQLSVVPSCSLGSASTMQDLTNNRDSTEEITKRFCYGSSKYYRTTKAGFVAATFDPRHAATRDNRP